MKSTLRLLFFRLLFLFVLGLSGMGTSMYAQSWTSVESGGINISSTTTIYNQQLQSFNSALYAVWIESGKVRIKRYDGGTTWTVVDGGGKYWTSATCSGLATAVYNNVLYMAWQEPDTEVGGISRIHVLKYDGTTFTFVQSHTSGSADDGKHYVSLQQTQYAYSPALGVNNGKLYASWIEGTNATFNYQVHVSEFDGTYWKSVDGGNAEAGLNKNYAGLLNRTMPYLSMASYGNNLYVSWKEFSTVNNQYQLRVKRFDGVSTWAFVDGNAEAGMNYSATKEPQTPTITTCNGNLYAIWSEGTLYDAIYEADINQIRVKKYDGSSWSFADGGTTSGWNKNNTDLNNLAAAYNPVAMAYNNQLYAEWDESDIVDWQEQIRAVKYDGSTKTFIDGGANKGINIDGSKYAQMPALSEYNGELYSGWQENTGSSTPYLFRIKKYPLPGITASVTVPANSTYKAGNNLDFTVTFNKIETVAGGTPYIPVILNTGGTVNATYVSGSGTKILLFRYTVVTGNADADGIAVGSAIVLPTGCTMRDASTIDAGLTLYGVPSTSAVLVDAVAPTVTSINRQTPAETPTNATSLVYRVTFSENVTGVDISDFTLTTTGTATGTIASVSAATGTTIDMTVNSVSGNGTLRLDLKNSGTGITDIPGNAISGGFTAGQTYALKVLATVTTQAVTGIGSTTATGNGNVTYLGVPNPTQYGVVWSTAANPTVDLATRTEQGAVAATGAFISNIIGLTPSTTYNVRAYATNDLGTAYGDAVIFTTLTATGLNDAESKALSVYPNPAADYIIVQGADKGELAVFDMSGRLILTSLFVTESNVDISSLAQGIYTVRITTSWGVIEKKLIKK